MLDYSYLVFLQVFTPMHVLLHIYVLTCMNIPITVRSCDHPQQMTALMLTILSMFLLPMSVYLSVAHYCTYTTIIIIIMLYDHMPHMYSLKFPTLQIIMFINLYDYLSVVN